MRERERVVHDVTGVKKRESNETCNPGGGTDPYVIGSGWLQRLRKRIEGV